MASSLTAKALEKSTYVIGVAFLNEDGNAVTPNNITWSLKTLAGVVVNSRDGVSVTPADSINIVLQGDDLEVTDGDDYKRVVTILADYDSNNGSGLPLKDEVYFEILNMRGVASA